MNGRTLPIRSNRRHDSANTMIKIGPKAFNLRLHFARKYFHNLFSCYLFANTNPARQKTTEINRNIKYFTTMVLIINFGLSAHIFLTLFKRSSKYPTINPTGTKAIKYNESCADEPIRNAIYAVNI